MFAVGVKRAFLLVAFALPLVAQAQTNPEVTVTILTDPVGALASVDGVAMNGRPPPGSRYYWATGSAHSLGTSSPQRISISPNSEYFFESWSQGGDSNQTYVATTDATLTLRFYAMHLMQFAATVPSGGFREKGAEFIEKYAQPCRAGDAIDIEVITPTSFQGGEFVFGEWSDGSAENPRHFACDAPAYFAAQYVQAGRSAAAPPPPPPAPGSQLPVRDLVGAEDRGADVPTVVLRWAPPPDVLGYQIFRGTERIGTIDDPTATQYADTTTWRATHTYRVVALGQGGQASAEVDVSVEGPERPQGFTITVTPTRFEHGTRPDIVVTLIDSATGRPVPMAGVTVFSAIAPNLAYTQATTDARGIVTFSASVIDPDETGLRVLANQALTTGETSITLAMFVPPPPDPWWMPWRAYWYVWVLGLVTMGAPFGANALSARRFKESAEDFKDDRAAIDATPRTVAADAPPLARLAPSQLHQAWRAAFRELAKDHASFVPLTRIERAKPYLERAEYSAIARAHREVEYFRTDEKRVRIRESYQLYVDPKPNVPTRYTDDEQAFPIDQEERACVMCSAHGVVQCPTCWGTGQEDCGLCDGDGKESCAQCGGSGEIKSGTTNWQSVDSTGHKETVAQTTQYTSCNACFGTGHRTCSKCNGRGKLPCGKCGATGRIVCPECEGDKYFRFLKRKVWTYKHERLREFRDVARTSSVKVEALSAIGNSYVRLTPAQLADHGAWARSAEGVDDRDALAKTLSVAYADQQAYLKAASGGRLLFGEPEDSHVFPLTWCVMRDADAASDLPAEAAALDTVARSRVERAPQGEATFRIFAFGGPRRWILDSHETGDARHKLGRKLEQRNKAKIVAGFVVGGALLLLPLLLP